jgi:hypothetical protein
MTPGVIEEFAVRLPLNSALFKSSLGEMPVTQGDRFAAVLQDPSFAWNIAHAYHLAGQPLPLFIQQGRYPPLRAFKYLSSPQSPDRELAKVHALHMHRAQSALLESFLLARDARIMDIGSYFQLSGAEVLLYAHLFYNVRHRLENSGWILSLLDWRGPHPRPRRRGPEPAIEELNREAELRVKRVAYHQGIAALLLALRLDKAAGPPADVLQRIMEAAGAQALPPSIQGLFSLEENPALGLLVRAGVQHAAEKPDKYDPLTTVSLSNSVHVSERFMQCVSPKAPN